MTGGDIKYMDMCRNDMVGFLVNDHFTSILAVCVLSVSKYNETDECNMSELHLGKS